MGRRIGLALVLILCFANTKTSGQVVEFLGQNWNEETRQKFYTTSQGSRLLPYKWFLALEMKDSTELFSGAHLKELGFLPNATSTGNPDGLPVGFVQDEDWAGKQHLGLTCAACHTSQIKFKTKTFQIDGGPTLADTWGLLQGIGESLNATQQNPDIEFDSKKVGFRTEAGPGTTLLDTTLPGNRNTGHDMYGKFNENERWALVEYMKSL